MHRKKKTSQLRRSRQLPLAASLPLAGVLLSVSLISGCASSATNQQDAAGQPTDRAPEARDSGQADRSRSDARAPDLPRLGDGSPKPEALHFWDATTDRGTTADTVSNVDLVSLPDRAGAQDSRPSSDLPQGPDPGPVQCRSDGDCGGTLTCNMSAPGGICSGCGVCPGWLECYSGFCVRECYNDGECNAGFRCSSTDRCALRACDATTPCPAPYACGTNGYCARPTCPTGSCPPPLICTNGLCIEP